MLLPLQLNHENWSAFGDWIQTSPRTTSVEKGLCRAGANDILYNANTHEVNITFQEGCDIFRYFLSGRDGSPIFPTVYHGHSSTALICTCTNYLMFIHKVDLK